MKKEILAIVSTLGTNLRCFVPSCLVVSFLMLALLVSGCSSKSSGSMEGEGENGLSEAELSAEREARFAGGGIPTAEGEGPFRTVEFDFDSSAINSNARQNIEFNAELLREHGGLRVSLEGHADERGTAEYNLALGAERARAVKEVLVSLGISSSRLETVSYGEEVPVDPGHDETAWAANRRVAFSGYSDKQR